MKWLKETYGIKPRYVTCDFERSLMNSCKSGFEEAAIIPSFFHFVKSVWLMAGNGGLRK
jgi:hypothetical protein